MKLLHWGPVATTAASLFALTEAIVRGVDLLRTPAASSATMSNIELWASAPTLGYVFLTLGILGVVAALCRQWVPAALVHALLGGVFLVMGIVALPPAIDLGFTFRAPLSYLLVFVPVHIFSASAFVDRWLLDHGPRTRRRLDQ